MAKTKPNIKALAANSGKSMKSRVVSSGAQDIELHVPNSNLVLLVLAGGPTLQIPMKQWEDWCEFVELQSQGYKSEILNKISKENSNAS